MTVSSNRLASQHFGLLCPPAPSHVTSLRSVGEEIIRRGGRATMFNIADVGRYLSGSGVGLVPLRPETHPLGSLQRFTEEVGKLKGWKATQVGLRAALAETDMLLEDAPDCIQEAGVTALIVDQGQSCGSSIASKLNLPFFTFCAATSVSKDPAVPPSFTDWSYNPGFAARVRNRAAIAIMLTAIRPIKTKINAARKKWGLAPLRSLLDTSSPLGQFGQQTEDFDFPDRRRPAHFHFIGMLEKAPQPGIEFPYYLLNGKPLIYCSFGTINSGLTWVHDCVAEACASLDVQLILANLSGEKRTFAGDPIVVGYAPQVELLSRSSLSICHGGNNSVLESLSFGLPTVAIPIANDQFGNAARLRRSGAGDFIPLKALNADRLRSVLIRLQESEEVSRCAVSLSASIRKAGGTRRMVDVIETLLPHEDHPFTHTA